MTLDQWGALDTRLRSVVQSGKSIAVLGWTDRNHSTFTRRLAEGKRVHFLPSPVREIPADVGLVLLTPWVTHADSRRANRDMLCPLTLGSGQIKRLLSASQDLLPVVKMRTRVVTAAAVPKCVAAVVPAKVNGGSLPPKPTSVAIPKSIPAPVSIPKTVPPPSVVVASAPLPPAVPSNMLAQVQNAWLIVASESVLLERQAQLKTELGRFQAEVVRIKCDLARVGDELTRVALTKEAITTIEQAISNLGVLAST